MSDSSENSIKGKLYTPASYQRSSPISPGTEYGTPRQEPSSIQYMQVPIRNIRRSAPKTQTEVGKNNEKVDGFSQAFPSNVESNFYKFNPYSGSSYPWNGVRVNRTLNTAPQRFVAKCPFCNHLIYFYCQGHHHPIY